MVNFKSVLLAATIVAGAVASPALAQTNPNPIYVPLPAPVNGAIRGAGATAIERIIVRNMNCIGTDKPRGASAAPGTFVTVTPGLFSGPLPAITLDCSSEANNIQSNFSGEYVGTGSGNGRRLWRDLDDSFDGGTPGRAQAGVINPFGNLTTPATRWPNVQFGFSEAPVSPGDMTTYTSRAQPRAGAAITFPLFVVPVAIAYSNVYGTKVDPITSQTVEMVFNAQGTGIGNSTTAAVKSIRLSRSAYCGIFNGTILNWNHPDLQYLNRRISLHDPVNDTASRWAADGAPIRLVGRFDNSGTTNIFTRHLTAVCNPTSAPGLTLPRTAAQIRLNQPATVAYATFTGTNKFTNANDALPYNASSGVNLVSGFAGTSYNGSATPSTALSGSDNSIGREYFNGTAVVATATGPTSSPNGNVGSGLFLVAEGNSLVSQAIVLPADYELNGVKLNGKIGYVSADFIVPSVDAPPRVQGGLFAASLQSAVAGVLSNTIFTNPTVTSARKAFGTILPPQSDAGGLFVATDTRQVRANNGTTTGLPRVNATRDNPLAWADVLYTDAATTLAAPNDGYPMTGVTVFMGYTCYASTNREQMVHMLGVHFAKIGRTGAGTLISRNPFGNTNPAALGIDVQSNIGIVPIAWANAISNTFLNNTVDAGAAALNLWIQNAYMPTYQALKRPNPVAGATPAFLDYNPVRTSNIRTATTANPSCSVAGRTGA
jgi:hypothetical protein